MIAQNRPSQQIEPLLRSGPKGGLELDKSANTLVQQRLSRKKKVERATGCSQNSLKVNDYKGFSPCMIWQL